MDASVKMKLSVRLRRNVDAFNERLKEREK